MTPEKLQSEFRDELRGRAERHCAGHLHQAFLHWFIEAKFGRVDWKFTDDTNDGGIDAVVWCPDDIPTVVVIQSKFTEKIGGQKLGKLAYQELERVAEAFRFGGAKLEELTGRVRDDLKPIYRKVHQQLGSANNWLTKRKAFRLITTSSRNSQAEFDGLPREAFLYADDVLRLYAEYRKVWTPQARDLALSVNDKLCYKDPKRGVTSYPFNAQLTDFRKYLERNDVARLVARNIRYRIKGKVGPEIRKTFERHPHDFWYLHNGLTIICDDFIEKDQVATLTNPSVVNGAQTLFALEASGKKTSSALVAVRVIVRGSKDLPMEDDEWIQRIIQGVNTQNRVRAYEAVPNLNRNRQGEFSRRKLRREFGSRGTRGVGC